MFNAVKPIMMVNQAYVRGLSNEQFRFNIDDVLQRLIIHAKENEWRMELTREDFCTAVDRLQDEDIIWENFPPDYRTHIDRFWNK